MPPDLDAAADDLRRFSLEANATPSEKLRLIAEHDPSVMLVQLAFSSSSDGDGPRDVLVRTDGRPAEVADTNLDELGPSSTATARAIAERVRLRVTLGLKARDCHARLQREGCRCLQEALDRLLEVNGVNKKWVVSLAKDLHKQQAAADAQAKRELQARAKEANLRAKSAQESSEFKSQPATPQASTVKRAHIHLPPAEPRLERDKSGETWEILPDGRRRRWRRPRRTPRWYDEAEGRGSILNKKF